MKTTIKYILLLIGITANAQLVQETTTYSYDYLNRLVQVVFDDGSTHNYVYDNLGNRIQLNTQTLDIDSVTLQNAITVYPNPTKEILNIKVPESIIINEDLTITLYDINGKIINQVKPKIIDHNLFIRVSELSIGTYIVHLKNGNNQWSQIVIKK